MDGYELGVIIHENEEARLKVFAARGNNRPGEFIVKQYSCSSYEEADMLLKNAVAQARQPFPVWSALKEVLMQQNKKSTDFIVNLIIEKFVMEVPTEIITNSERVETSLPGLSGYETGSLLYRNPVSNEEIFVSRRKDNQQEVVLKKSKLVMKFQEANKMLTEAMIQAHVSHEHNTELLDIALLAEQRKFKICLIIERLRTDVKTELQERKKKNQQYSEDEILEFMLQVTTGLIHAKNKNIAHCDIKPANIFISFEGKYKVGDFGSAWVKHQGKRAGFELLGAAQHQYESLTGNGTGTIPYLSPEMRKLILGLRDKVNPHISDVYSLGVTVVELAKLEYPTAIQSVNKENLVNLIEREVDNLNCSTFVKKLLLQMLRVEPTERCILEYVHHEVEARLSPRSPVVDNINGSMPPAQLAVLEKDAKAKILKLEKLGERAKLRNAYRELSIIYHAQKGFVFIPCGLCVINEIGRTHFKFLSQGSGHSHDFFQ